MTSVGLASVLETRRHDVHDTSILKAMFIKNPAPALFAFALSLPFLIVLPVVAEAPEDLEIHPFDLKKRETTLGILVYRWDDEGRARAQAASIRVQELNSKKQELSLRIDQNGKIRRKKVARGETFQLFRSDPIEVTFSGLDRQTASGELLFDRSTLQAGDGYAVGVFGKMGRILREVVSFQKDRVGEEGATPFDTETRGEEVVFPKLVHRTLPKYTRRAAREGIQGRLMMRMVVRRDGRTDRFVPLTILGFGLDRTAVETVANTWLFRPGTVQAQPVDITATIEVTFSLH